MSTEPRRPTAPTMRDYLERAHAAQEAVNELGMGGRVQPTAHDLEEAMRPYLGEVFDARETARLLGQAPTPLECAYRAALDRLLDLVGVSRP